MDARRIGIRAMEGDIAPLLAFVEELNEAIVARGGERFRRQTGDAGAQIVSRLLRGPGGDAVVDEEDIDDDDADDIDGFDAFDWANLTDEDAARLDAELDRLIPRIDL